MDPHAVPTRGNGDGQDSAPTVVQDGETELMHPVEDIARPAIEHRHTKGQTGISGTSISGVSSSNENLDL